MNSVNIYEDRWIAIKIFLTVFLISNLFFKPDLSFARFVFLTKAFAHYGTTSIEKIQQISGIKGNDYFIVNGHTYLQPPPGLSFIALLSYLPYSAFLQSRLIHIFFLEPSLEFKISQFIMALSTVTLFTALLIAIFFLSLRKIGCPQKKAIIFSFLLYFGTPVIFYSLNISNGQNILEAAILFIAFFIMNISKMQKRSLVFLSGLLCGLAVFVNVVALFFLPLFLSIILLSRRWQNFFIWTIGTILGFIPLLIYNQISFGNVLTFSYNVYYSTSLLFRPISSLKATGILLFSPTVGLIFFLPFIIMLLLMLRKLWVNLMNRLILCTVLFYTICLSIVFWSIFLPINYENSVWFFLNHNQGGGGSRYLLPIIPFLMYVIASANFDLAWKKILASVLIFISVIINTPGLFWTGGQVIFYNNLILFLKNGFHSYMIDLIRDMLISGGFNTSGLSIFPLLIILGIFIWWIWSGERNARLVIDQTSK